MRVRINTAPGKRETEKVAARGRELPLCPARALRLTQRMPKKASCIPMLKALSDETRWRIVRALLSNTMNVTELVDALGVTQYNVSKHVRILREAGIVRTEKQGKHLLCSVEPEFRTRVAENKNQLDLGCCVFRFD
jgi:DNA-binding transcriptional ArsR family regulator